VEKKSLYDSDYYVISRDYKILYFNDSVARTYKGIKVGDCCYEATMKRDKPCLHCPIAGNVESDCPIYFDPFYEKWIEADFCKLKDDSYAVFCKPADQINEEIFKMVTDDEQELLRSKASGEAANDVLHAMANRANTIIQGNKRLFFFMVVLDLKMDTCETLFAENWVIDILGYQNTASEALKLIASELVMPFMQTEMLGYNDYSSIAKRLKGRSVLSQKFECITDESARAIIMPIEFDKKGNAVKVVYGLANSNHELQSLQKDPLTGLYTRNAFLSIASEWINARPFSTINIIVTDIKNFKNVNSVYGEKKANELLKYLANFIDSRVPDGICARYGADQIVCMYTSTQKRTLEWYEDFVISFAEDAPIPYVNLKAGIYQNADRNISVITMCDRALMALKSIKHSYESSVAFYDGKFSRRLIKMQEYESRFVDAIKAKEFKVWFQPKYEPYNEKLVGAEALVRWEQEAGKFIPPAEFIGMFEEDGLINALDEYVFTSVCELLQKWKKEGKRVVPVSVNLSRNSMRRIDLVNNYKQIAEDYGIDLDKIPIEITESAAVGNSEFKPMADALHDAGFTIHMDDFGSEHSSLNGLSNLHLSAVKFDKSLIDDIGLQSGDTILIYTMALARELGLAIVAEGVENENQLKFLKHNECDFIQGYLYSKPVPLKEFEKMLK